MPSGAQPVRQLRQSADPRRSGPCGRRLPPRHHYGEDWEFCIRLALQGPFAAAAGNALVLFVCRHANGAYCHLATEPASFSPCMDTIFANRALIGRFGAERLAVMRRRTEAENAWVIGRELLRPGRTQQDRAWLSRSFHAAPSLKRAALLALAAFARGPFAPYAGFGHRESGSV